MLVLFIIIAVVTLFLILPVGIDLLYSGGKTVLKAKLGPFRIALIPEKRGKPKPKKKTTEKPATKKKQAGHAMQAKQKALPKLRLRDIMELARIALRALAAIRKNLSIDLLRLYICCGAEDPYDAVMRYGYLNAGLGALAPPFHAVCKVREEDVQTFVDFAGGKTELEAHLIVSLQIWEILSIGASAGWAVFRWYRNRRRNDRKMNAGTIPAEQKG